MMRLFQDVIGTTNNTTSKDPLLLRGNFCSILDILNDSLKGKYKKTNIYCIFNMYELWQATMKVRAPNSG
jgi:SpoVK/Ycf46/Vps4 family AAA+-type ATPase